MNPLGFEIVEAPLAAPYACETCGAQKGPVLDSHVIRPVTQGEIRLYFCLDCVAQMAETAGFAEGEQMAELQQAAKLMHEHEREIERLRKGRVAQTNVIAQYGEEIDRLKNELEQSRLLEAQSRAQLNEVRKATTATVASFPEREAVGS